MNGVEMPPVRYLSGGLKKSLRFDLRRGPRVLAVDMLGVLGFRLGSWAKLCLLARPLFIGFWGPDFWSSPQIGHLAVRFVDPEKPRAKDAQ